MSAELTFFVLLGSGVCLLFAIGGRVADSWERREARRRTVRRFDTDRRRWQ